MQKTTMAISEQSGASGDMAGGPKARRDSTVVPAPEGMYRVVSVTVGPEFVGNTVNAIRTVVAAGAVGCAVRSTRARTPYGFSYDADGERPSFLSDPLPGVLDLAQGELSGVYIESMTRDLPSFFDSTRFFENRGDGDRAWLVLRDADGIFGAIVLARSVAEGPFSAEEGRKLEELAPLLTCAMRAELDSLDSRCELATLRALGSAHGTCLLFERDLERVVWASSRGKSVDWDGAIEPFEQLFARSIETLLQAQHNDEVLPTPPRFPLGMVVAVAPVREETPFGSRCIAVGILPSADEYSPIALLSARERAVARLLIKGYEPANIAAITGIAEHTVRTYIRRAYKKLGVCRRADLVRRLLAPDPGDACSPRK